MSLWLTAVGVWPGDTFPPAGGGLACVFICVCVYVCVCHEAVRLQEACWRELSFV